MAEKSISLCQQCRREGKKLFLKGERCFSPKCGIVKRNYPPGAHGPQGKSRLTPYGIGLREKQKMKRFYGLREKQFHNYFIKAKRKVGDTGEIFLSMLERRLDNIIYRMSFSTSRTHARQLVSHGHVLVNGKEVNIASYQVRANDIVSLNESIRKTEFVKALMQEEHPAPPLQWLEVNRKEVNGKIISIPKKADLEPIEFDLKQIVEFYSH